MAEVGLPPKKLAKAPIPKCAGCMFAAMTKKPWHSKGKNTCGQVGRMTNIISPGQCVSVNMLESPQVGFIAHMKERLTRKRYRYATVFVDHFLDLKYVHCMSKITLEETIYAKKCFDRHADGFNVRVEHYQAIFRHQIHPELQGNGTGYHIVWSKRALLERAHLEGYQRPSDHGVENYSTC